MKTTKLIRFVRSNWIRAVLVALIGVAAFTMAMAPFAQPPDDPPLTVMKMGLGSGTVTSNTSTDGVLDINCGTDCDHDYVGTPTVILTAREDGGSTFAGWDLDEEGNPGPTDCRITSPNTCEVTIRAARSVRAVFTLDAFIPTITNFTPEGIEAYLNTYRTVNSAARFIKALPPEYKMNWILMSRSESLQTGTAQMPRILLPSADGRFVFTIGMAPSSSYPGSHKNAIEFMQWDNVQKNFRFHEIVLARIDPMGDTITFLPGASTITTFPGRDRGVSDDDARCSKCHSTRNILNVVHSVPPVRPPVRGSLSGTDIIPPGTAFPPETVMVKNKPNWDTYDSWGGMMPFNRDRIYQGSVEAAAFRHIFNLWNWRNSPENDAIREIIEQLKLQPPHVPTPGPHSITRNLNRTADNDHIRFGFDSLPALSPAATPTPIGYSFDRTSEPPTPVTQYVRYVTLRHSNPMPVPGTSNDEYAAPVTDEGRAVQFFDLLGGADGNQDLNRDMIPDGNLNAQRIADELIKHRFAPGSVPVDVRPLALALTKPGCIRVSGGTVSSTPSISPSILAFLQARNGGLTIADVLTDTRTRAESITRRKADIQKINLERSIDLYLAGTPAPTPFINGLIQQYGAAVSATPDTSLNSLRKEVFRRPIDLGNGDNTVMGRVYVDREDYTLGPFNTEKIALYRFFLEPFGVSVDKWSMGVRGRSRTYTFADVLDDPAYQNPFINQLEASLSDPRDPFPEFGSPPRRLTAPYNCADLISAVNSSLSSLPADGGGPIPTYTDVQRIFNKSCIECHGGLLYPPFRNHVIFPDPANPGRIDERNHLDLSEEEYPVRDDRRRMRRSHTSAVRYVSPPPAEPGLPPVRGLLYDRITDYDMLTHPYNPVTADENCPRGLMPCGGPPLSNVDIEIIRRWIDGPPRAAYTEGDPHIKTVDGTDYDFQSAGEFVLLRDESLEIQARQTPVQTESPLGPNNYTGLRSCVSVNSAVAIRFDENRITYQPDISGNPDSRDLQLRVDGKLMTISARGIPLSSGVRIMPTTAEGGIRIEVPGGTVVVITPIRLDYYQLWQMNIDVSHARATEGIMGAIAPGSWLPALPDGSSLGPKPSDFELHQRYVDLYEKFEDAWRVNDATTLFDYAPGTSTSTFSLASWPTENPQVCTLAPRPGGPPVKPPLAPLALEVAQQHCRGIVAEDRRANCVIDVMAMGEPGIAKTYLLTEQIELNKAPSAPVLGSPENYKNNQTDLTVPITFTWNSATDPDGDVVTYRHCVRLLGERPDNNKCEPTVIQTTSWRKGLSYALPVALVGCFLLAALIFFAGLKKRPALLISLAIVMLVGATLAFLIGRTKTSSGTLSKTVSGLEPGREYFWKVIAEDGKGGMAESNSWRFRTK